MENYQGSKDHKVTVKPDEDAKVVVFYKTKKPLQLWTEKCRVETNENIIEFKTHNWTFNNIFKTRRASKSFAQTITDSPILINKFVQFYLDWIWSLESIYVSDNAIYSGI